MSRSSSIRRFGLSWGPQTTTVCTAPRSRPCSSASAKRLCADRCPLRRVGHTEVIDRQRRSARVVHRRRWPQHPDDEPDHALILDIDEGDGFVVDELLEEGAVTLGRVLGGRWNRGA
jgi:hypothetical protein